MALGQLHYLSSANKGAPWLYGYTFLEPNYNQVQPYADSVHMPKYVFYIL